jgi:hypothetical protein
MITMATIVEPPLLFADGRPVCDNRNSTHDTAIK